MSAISPRGTFQCLHSYMFPNRKDCTKLVNKLHYVNLKETAVFCYDCLKTFYH